MVVYNLPSYRSMSRSILAHVCMNWIAVGNYFKMSAFEFANLLLVSKTWKRHMAIQQESSLQVQKGGSHENWMKARELIPLICIGNPMIPFAQFGLHLNRYRYKNLIWPRRTGWTKYLMCQDIQGLGTHWEIQHKKKAWAEIAVCQLIKIPTKWRVVVSTNVALRGQERHGIWECMIQNDQKRHSRMPNVVQNAFMIETNQFTTDTDDLTWCKMTSSVPWESIPWMSSISSV